MILYWNEYKDIHPDYIDVSTKNKSFLKMSLILRRMGVKNNKFMLLLTQPELKGIDPHNLPEDSGINLKMKIAYECKINPWYYFREVIRIPVTGSLGGVPFILNRANLALIWLYFNNVDNFLIMPRQIGKTMGTLSIDSWLLYIGGNNLTKTMLTKSDKLRKENVARLKEIKDLLPKYLISKSSKDINNMDELGYEELKTKYMTFVSQSSANAAEAMGRGLTTPSQHWDEVAFFDNIQISYPSAVNATIAAVEGAKEFNQPYANILTTTAGRLDTKSGKFAYSLLCKSLTFTEFFYDVANTDALKDVLKKNSPNRMFYCEYSYQQLGKDEEWFKERSARSSGDADQIKMDFLNTWVYGSESSAIDAEILERVIGSKKDVEYVQINEGFVIKWYIPERVVRGPSFHDIPIVIGSDSSENIGKDFTSFIFVDARDLSVIGTCRCNTANIITVAMFIYKYLKRGNALFAPERNHVGSAMIDAILLEMEKDGINPFTRIYNEIIQNRNKEERFKDINIYSPGTVNKYRKHFGFRTTSSSSRGRTFLYKVVFFKALELGAERIHDTDLINEISGLTVSSKGRIDHKDDGHDDMVIGYIMACNVLFFGENLMKYDFCKDASTILSNVRKTETIEKEEFTIDVDLLKRRLITLKERLKRTHNPTLQVRIKMKISEIEKLLPDDADVLDDIPSIEQLKTSTSDVRTPVERYNETKDMMLTMMSVV